MPYGMFIGRCGQRKCGDGHGAVGDACIIRAVEFHTCGQTRDVWGLCGLGFYFVVWGMPLGCTWASCVLLRAQSQLVGFGVRVVYETRLDVPLAVRVRRCGNAHSDRAMGTVCRNKLCWVHVLNAL